MAVGFARIVIENRQIKTIALKEYNSTIYDETCDEISAYARELNLDKNRNNMSTECASVRIEDDKITIIKKYGPAICDAICNEISSYAMESNLNCLKYLKAATTCFFNYDQCADIVTKEIPVLRTKSLSKNAQKTLEELEFAIKKGNDPWGFLLLERE